MTLMLFLILCAVCEQNVVGMYSNDSSSTDIDAFPTNYTENNTTDAAQAMMESILETCAMISIPMDRCTCKYYSFVCNMEHGKEPNLPVFTNKKEICEFANKTMDKCSCKYIPLLCMIKEVTKDSRVRVVNLRFRDEDLVYASTVVFGFVIGVIGNSLVIAVAYKERADLTRNKLLISILAGVDVTFCVVQLIKVVPLFWEDVFIYGLVMCKMINSFILLGNLLSIGFIMIIALERYFGILYPFRRDMMSRKITITIIAMNVVCGIVTVVPYFMALNIDKDIKRCEEKWHGGKQASLIYQWFLMISYFVIPVTIITALYITILRHLWRQTHNNEAVNRKDILTRRVRENRRIMFIIISILVGFVACTLPNRAIWIYQAMHAEKIKSFQQYKALTYLALISYPIQNWINPVLYSAIDRNWRNSMLKILGISRSKLNQVHGKNMQKEKTKISTITNSV